MLNMLWNDNDYAVKDNTDRRSAYSEHEYAFF